MHSQVRGEPSIHSVMRRETAIAMRGLGAYSPHVIIWLWILNHYT